MRNQEDRAFGNQMRVISCPTKKLFNDKVESWELQEIDANSNDGWKTRLRTTLRYINTQESKSLSAKQEWLRGEKKRLESLAKENSQSLKEYDRIADALSQIKMQALTNTLSHIKNFYLDANEEDSAALKKSL